MNFFKISLHLGGGGWGGGRAVWAHEIVDFFTCAYTPSSIEMNALEAGQVPIQDCSQADMGTAVNEASMYGICPCSLGPN